MFVMPCYKLYCNPSKKHHVRRPLIAQKKSHKPGQTDGRTNAHYQMYYLPCFAIDKYIAIVQV